MQALLIKMHTAKSDLNGILFPERLVLVNVLSVFGCCVSIDLHIGFNPELPPGHQLLLEEYPVESCVSNDVEIVKVVRLTPAEDRLVYELRKMHSEMFQLGQGLGSIKQEFDKYEVVETSELDDYIQYILCRAGADIPVPDDCEYFGYYIISGAAARRRK